MVELSKLTLSMCIVAPSYMLLRIGGDYEQTPFYDYHREPSWLCLR